MAWVQTAVGLACLALAVLAAVAWRGAQQAATGPQGVPSWPSTAHIVAPKASEVEVEPAAAEVPRADAEGSPAR